jgi:cobalt transporter subunit CbtA
MTFRGIVLAAILVGIVSGTIYGIFQQLQINPIIYAAENFEVESSEAMLSTEAGQGHSDEQWAPGDGLQRIASTLGSNILVAIGFSLILISAMSLHNAKSSRPGVNWKSGILWGLGLLVSIFVAPALVGVHPEIPGTIAESLDQRQLWWISSTTVTAAGLLVLYYAAKLKKLVGIVLIAAPHMIGAPITQSLTFANTEPAAVEALNELTNQFVVMTSIGMLIFCVLLGALCGSAAARLAQQT